jgi:hypothetical protein
MLAAPAIAGGLMATECCLMLLWRVAEGEWRAAMPGMDARLCVPPRHVREKYPAGRRSPVRCAALRGTSRLSTRRASHWLVAHDGGSAVVLVRIRLSVGLCARQALNRQT